MNESRLTSIKQLRAFLDGTVEVEFRRFADAERYEHIVSVLCRFRYAGLKRVEKGVVLRYLMHTTGYSRQQVTRLVRQYRSRGCLRKNYQTPAHGFARKFTAADRALLAETDRVHGTLSGPADQAAVATGLRGFWGSALCAVSYPLGLASVQPAGVCRLPRATHALEQDPWESGTHRRKASARARRAPRFYPHRQRATRGDQDGLKACLEVTKGGLSHQCGGLRYPMGVRGLL
ncbi:MAG: hypothetical protein ACREYE_05530 [Gammaproteobacteria bacterium]